MTLTDLRITLKNNYFFIIIFVVILLCISVIAFVLLQPKTRSSSQELQVTQTKPADGQKQITLFPDIAISLSRDLTATEQQKVVISASPTIDGSMTWTSPNSLVLKSTTPLKQETLYTVSVRYPGGSFTWNFTTEATSQTSTEDQVKIQTQADKEYGDHMKETREKYPWNTKLPIQTPRYYVYFDIKQEVFRGYVFTSASTNVDESKIEATNQLRQLEIPVDQYSLIWEVR